MSLLPFDILEEIFNHFDVESNANARAPLFQALFVSKAVYRVALRCLWRYLSSPLPLIRLLPFVKVAGGTYVIDTLTPSGKHDWSPFNTHASLVVKVDYITFHPYPTSPSLNYEAIFSHLLFLDPSASRLFTRLTEFQILFRTTPTKEELTLFSNAPNIERLELHSVNEYDPPDRRVYGIDEFVRGITAGANASLKHLILPRPTFQSSLHHLSNLEGSLRSLTLMWPCTELSPQRLGFGSSDTVSDSPEGNLQGTPSPWYPLDQIALEQLGSLVNLTRLDIDFSVVTGPNYRFPSASRSNTDFASTNTAPDSTSLLSLHSGISLPSLQYLTLKSYVPLATNFLFSLQHSSKLQSLEIVSVLGELKDWEDLFGVIGSTWGAEGRLLHTLRCTDMHLAGTMITRSSPSTDDRDRGSYTITSLLTPLFPLSSTLRNLTLRGFQYIHCPDSAVTEVLEGLSGLEQVALPIPAPVAGTSNSGRRGSRTIGRTADDMERPTWNTLVSISKGKIGKRLRRLEIALDSEAAIDSEMDLFRSDSRNRRTNNGLRNSILGRLEGRRPIRIGSGRGTGKDFMWGYEYSGYEVLNPYALLNGSMAKTRGTHYPLRHTRHLSQKPESSPLSSPLRHANANHTTDMALHPLRHLTILSSSLPSTHAFHDGSELIAKALNYLFPSLDSVEGKEYTASCPAFTSEPMHILRSDGDSRAHDKYREQWIKVGELVGIFSRGE
ncbi:hypothetical protein VKT23_014339 [Stygiomarasmius scandens]|uniref:F-box domain-containing protein n=1 Tax=Marasmiellus scandens TaxID=2682957 RepID=A0ABR1J1R1_9AGAR